GVQYLWDTTVCGALMGTDGTTLQGVAVESKSGREAILANVVVDATGDADVAALAGAPVHTLRDIPGAKHSFVFRIGNVDVDAFVQYFIDHRDQYPEHMDVDWSLEEAVEQYRQVGTFLFPHGGGMQMDIIKQGVERGEYPTKIGVHDTLDALQMHAIRDLGVVHVITGFLKLADLDIAAITRGMADGRRMAFQVTDFFRRYMPGFSRAAVMNTADDLGIRASRWLDGDFVFTKEMRGTPVRFPDAIGRGVVEEFRVKHPGPRAWATEVLAGECFDIPYRCLLPRKVDGLVMGAGRSVSAQDPHLLRIMAVTMIVGQGAGVAAAMSARAGCAPREVQIGAVQEELRRQGVALG
ncbi:FAD-dependent oxidoreductase, partial [bacterium]|nr:FAD-dependent oxidoreductase [bacterium]